MVVIRGLCHDIQVRPLLSLNKICSPHKSFTGCECACACVRTRNYVSMYACFCVDVPVFVCACLKKNRLNLIYSPRGHLLTESSPLTGLRRNGSLTRLLLYIAAVMGTSLETVLLLICALQPRFEQ